VIGDSSLQRFCEAAVHYSDGGPMAVCKAQTQSAALSRMASGRLGFAVNRLKKIPSVLLLLNVPPSFFGESQRRQLVLFPTPDPLQAFTLGVEKSLSAIG